MSRYMCNTILHCFRLFSIKILGITGFVLCAIPVSIKAQTPGLLKGSITDVNSGPLPGAIVFELANPSSGVVADGQGFYQFRLKPGDHTLVCKYLGMIPDTFYITMKEGIEVIHNFRLHTQSSQLNGVVVSASRFRQKIEETTVSMQLIPSRLIENRNTVNVKSALEQTPGLVILDEEPQMRGGSGFSFGVGSRVATLIDGLPIITGDAGRTDWSFIPVENVQQIEVVEGASSVLYGSSALNGIINFISRSPGDSGYTYVRAYSGFYSAPENDSAKWWEGNANFSGVNFSNGQRFGKTDLVFGGQLNYDHNYIGPYILDGSLPIQADTLDNSDVANRSGRINFNVRTRPSGNDALSVGLSGNFMVSHSNFSLVWGNSNSGIYRAFPGTMTISDNTAFYLDPYANFVGSKGGVHNLKTRWYYSDNKNNNGQSNLTHVLLADYNYNRVFEKLKDLQITTGLFVNQSSSKADLYSGSGDNENILKNRSVFLQLNQEYFHFLTVMAGVRGEFYRINDETEEIRPVFRSGINARLFTATHLRCSYGQGFRYPTIAEKFIITTTGGIYVFPNPDIKPESSWSAEAGLKQGFKIGGFAGMADVAYFHQEYENTIEYIYAIWQPDSAGFKFVNTGKTRVKGWELSVMGAGKPGGRIEIRYLVGYTWLKPQALEPSRVFATDNPDQSSGFIPKDLTYSNTSTDTTDNILKYRFRNIFKADLEISYNLITLGGSMRYYSFMQNIDQTFYDLDQTVLPTGIQEYREKNNKGSMVFDARVKLNIGRYYSVSLISENVTNKEYSLRPLKIESPRKILLQLALSI